MGKKCKTCYEDRETFIKRENIVWTFIEKKSNKNASKTVNSNSRTIYVRSFPVKPNLFNSKKCSKKPMNRPFLYKK